MAAFLNNSSSNQTPMEIDDSGSSPMDVSADSNPVDDLIQGLEKVNIGTKSSGYLLQGDAGTIGLKGSAAAECHGFMDTPRPVPQGEVIYIIAAHGIWNNTTTFRGINYPEGHGIAIEAPNEDWGNLNFGVLVSEGTLLMTKNNEMRQQAVIRHIQGIISGGIKVYQRFPWKEKGPDAPTAIFPNFIFGEGGGDTNPFVATIARYYKGNLQFFNLTRSVIAKTLVAFNPQAQYPGFGQYDPQNLNVNNFVVLSQILPIIEEDVKLRRSEGNDIKKTNVIFASCMENVPQSIHNIWIGRSHTKPPVMGGKRKKKKSKRQKSRRKKKSRKRKTRKRKSRRKKKSQKKRKRKTRKRKSRRKKKSRKRKTRTRKGGATCSSLTECSSCVTHPKNCLWYDHTINKKGRSKCRGKNKFKGRINGKNGWTKICSPISSIKSKNELDHAKVGINKDMTQEMLDKRNVARDITLKYGDNLDRGKKEKGEYITMEEFNNMPRAFEYDPKVQEEIKTHDLPIANIKKVHRIKMRVPIADSPVDKDGNKTISI